MKKTTVPVNNYPSRFRSEGSSRRSLARCALPVMGKVKAK
jgi:hypothetical protein